MPVRWSFLFNELLMYRQECGSWEMAGECFAFKCNGSNLKAMPSTFPILWILPGAPLSFLYLLILINFVDWGYKTESLISNIIFAFLSSRNEMDKFDHKLSDTKTAILFQCLLKTVHCLIWLKYENSHYFSLYSYWKMKKKFLCRTFLKIDAQLFYNKQTYI